MPGDKFYVSSEWVAFRRWFLQRFPYCYVKGCGERATHVDHKVSRRAGGAPFDPFNSVSYCASHHNSKTARFDMPGRKQSDMPVRARGCLPDGSPIDPLHSWFKVKNSRGG